MKVLHLFSDRRKTGPANPVLEMCRGLMERGHDVTLAYRAPQPRDFHRRRARDLEKAVAASKIPATTRFALNRYFGPIDLARDLVRLPRFLKRQKFEIVHTHLRLDQFLGVASVRLMGQDRPRIVMTMHSRQVLAPTAAYRALLRRADGLLAFTPGFRRGYIDRFDLEEQRVGLQPMTVDLPKFDPARRYQNMRQEFGIDPEAVVIGIVGRFQRYRKMEVFLAAAKRVAQAHPGVRFLIVGGSRTLGETVDRPARSLGIRDRVIIAGYRGPDYADCLEAMDIFSLLMPGSDGTARAVREGMAMGKPCVVSDFGMLPEIVPHGRAGLVCRIDDEGESLAAAWSQLVRDADLRRSLGLEARRIAVEQFDPAATAQSLERFYQQIMALPPR